MSFPHGTRLSAELSEPKVCGGIVGLDWLNRRCHCFSLRVPLGPLLCAQVLPTNTEGYQVAITVCGRYSNSSTWYYQPLLRRQLGAPVCVPLWAFEEKQCWHRKPQKAYLPRLAKAPAQIPQSDPRLSLAERVADRRPARETQQQARKAVGHGWGRQGKGFPIARDLRTSAADALCTDTSQPGGAYWKRLYPDGPFFPLAALPTGAAGSPRRIGAAVGAAVSAGPALRFDFASLALSSFMASSSSSSSCLALSAFSASSS